MNSHLQLFNSILLNWLVSMPIVLFPLLGIMPTSEVTLSYGNHLIFLFLGGFLIAVTIKKWNLHKRIALNTILLAGVSANQIILGFMLAPHFICMDQQQRQTNTPVFLLRLCLALLTPHPLAA